MSDRDRVPPRGSEPRSDSEIADVAGLFADLDPRPNPSAATGANTGGTAPSASESADDAYDLVDGEEPEASAPKPPIPIPIPTRGRERDRPRSSEPPARSASDQPRSRALDEVVPTFRDGGQGGPYAYREMAAATDAGYEDLDDIEAPPPPKKVRSRSVEGEKPDVDERIRRREAEEHERRKAQGRTPPEIVPWSRGREWGLSVVPPIVLGIGTIAATVYFLGFAETVSLGRALLSLIVGGALTLIAAIPLLATLEPPLRMVPEHALKEFYAALSAGRPQYKRMWLMLTEEAKSSRSFNGYAAFRSYWRKQLKHLSRGGGGLWNTLEFRVINFKSPQSKDANDVHARYELEVVDARSKNTVALFADTIDVFRGPDRMWHMNRGTLPETRLDRLAETRRRSN